MKRELVEVRTRGTLEKRAGGGTYASPRVLADQRTEELPSYMHRNNLPVKDRDNSGNGDGTATDKT